MYFEFDLGFDFLNTKLSISGIFRIFFLYDLTGKKRKKKRIVRSFCTFIIKHT